MWGDRKKMIPFQVHSFMYLWDNVIWWVAVHHILENFYNNIIPDLLWNDVIKDDFD